MRYSERFTYRLKFSHLVGTRVNIGFEHLIVIWEKFEFETGKAQYIFIVISLTIIHFHIA